MQRTRQRIGEGGQQHPGIGMPPGQYHGTVQRNDGLASAGGATDPSWPLETALDQLSLGRVEKRGPAIPGKLQRTGQFLGVSHHPETPLRIRMAERIGARRSRSRRLRPPPRGQFQQSLSRLRRQVIRQLEQFILVGRQHLIRPVGWHAIAEQILAAHTFQCRLRDPDRGLQDTTH